MPNVQNMPKKYKSPSIGGGAAPVGYQAPSGGLASTSAGLESSPPPAMQTTQNVGNTNPVDNQMLQRIAMTQTRGMPVDQPTQGNALPTGVDTQGGANVDTLSLTGNPTSTTPHTHEADKTRLGHNEYGGQGNNPGANQTSLGAYNGQIGVINSSGASTPPNSGPNGFEVGADRTDPSVKIDSDAQSNLAAEKQWDDVMKQYGDSYKNIDTMGRDFESRSNRRAMEMNARLGAGTGGGAFASGLGQAMNEGETNRLKMENDYQIRGMELKMTHLQHLLQQAKDKGDRAQQKDIQNMIDETMYNMELVRQGPSPHDRPSVTTGAA